MQQITGIAQSESGQNVKYSVSIGVYDSAGSIGNTSLDSGGEWYAVNDTGTIGTGSGTYEVLSVSTAVLAITGVNNGAKTFTLAGDQRSHFPVTGTFTVSGSTGNDGTYTVVSATHSTNTTITVVESIPDPTVDGSITSIYGPVTSFNIPDASSGYTVGGTSTTPGGPQAGLGADLEIEIDTIQFSDLSTIYSDNGITEAPNPFNTNENGGYSFYIAAGSTYYLVVLNSDDTQNYALQDVTVASTGGGGVIGGTIAANQLVQGTGTNIVGPISSGDTTWSIGDDGALSINCFGAKSCSIQLAENTDQSGAFLGIVPNDLTISDGTTEFDFSVNGTSLQLGTNKALVNTSGFLGIAQLRETVSNGFAGTCSMVAGTSCTFTLAAVTLGTALCIATAQGTNVTGGALACSVSGTTVTITAASSNSNTFAAVIIGTNEL